MWNKLSRLWQNSFFRCMAFMLLYIVVFFVVHSVLVSVIAFFHFQLNHGLSVIESWLYHRGWEVILISKVFSTFVVLKIIFLKSQSRRPFRDYLLLHYERPQKKTVVLSLAFIVFSFLIGNASFVTNPDSNVIKLLSSYLGHSVFFICDFLIFSTIFKFHPVQGFQKILSFVLFPLLVVYLSKLIVMHFDKNEYFVGLCIFFTLLLGSRARLNWTNPLLYILIYAAPIGAFVGWDALWGSEYSFVKMANEMKALQCFSLLVIGLVYVKLNYSSLRKLANKRTTFAE